MRLKTMNLKELFEKVSVKDCYDVTCFSGVNDISKSEHSIKKRELTNIFYQFIDNEYYAGNKSIDNYIDTIVKCIQDFYLWSHEFSHSDSPKFKRVMNALGISIETIASIKDKVEVSFCKGCFPPQKCFKLKDS